MWATFYKSSSLGGLSGAIWLAASNFFCDSYSMGGVLPTCQGTLHIASLCGKNWILKMGKDHVREKLITKQRTRFASRCHFVTYLLVFHIYSPNLVILRPMVAQRWKILWKKSDFGPFITLQEVITGQKKLTHNLCVWMPLWGKNFSQIRDFTCAAPCM